MKLQVALDLINKKQALNICKKIYKFVDIIELGTPLIKKEGLNILPRFKKFRKPILADMKIMDTGFLEALLAFKSGADMVTVCGCADNSTIIGTVRAAKQCKKKVVVDLIAVKDQAKRAKEVLKLGVDYIEIHTAIDIQKKGGSPLKNLAQISRLISKKKISVAGGIGLKNINDVIKYKPEIIVIGSAITSAKYPKKIAEVLKEKLK